MFAQDRTESDLWKRAIKEGEVRGERVSRVIIQGRHKGINRIVLAALIVVAAATLCMVTASIPANAAPVGSGLVQEEGHYRYITRDTYVTSSWKTVNKSKYYFDDAGNAVAGRAKNINGTYYVFSDEGKLLKPSKNKFYKLKNGLYYVNKKGRPAKIGWFILKGKLYKAGKSGKCVISEKVDGITFLKNGSAKPNTSSKLKMTVMRKLDKLTTPSMTKKQKLRQCFNYCYTRAWASNAEPKDIGKAGWMQRCAYKMLTRERTECFSFSCAFAAFAYELGYKPTVRGVPKNHAYVLINGRSYDNMGPRYAGTPRSLAGSPRNFKFDTWSTTKKSRKIGGSSKSNGLKKKQGSYYYYHKGKMVKNKWMNVGSSRYYFRSNGKAAVGPIKVKGTWYVFSKKGKLQRGKAGVVKVDKVIYRVRSNGAAHKGWTGKKLYLKNGRMATGVVLYKNKLYAFTTKGIYNKELSKSLNVSAKVNTDASELLMLLDKVEKPQKTRTEVSCYNLKGMAGDDIVFTYDNCRFNFFKGSDGITYFVSAEER